MHGQTAAEVIPNRADAKKPLMGMTSFKGNYITQHDTSIAKNYLTEEELKQLNLIVSLYLDFAELQATNKRAMSMDDWIIKLEEFLKLSEKDILVGAGKVSAQNAKKKAQTEYEEYRGLLDKEYLSDFDKEMKKYIKGK